jgi:hypothetical protein
MTFKTKICTLKIAFFRELARTQQEYQFILWVFKTKSICLKTYGKTIGKAGKLTPQ